MIKHGKQDCPAATHYRLHYDRCASCKPGPDGLCLAGEALFLEYSRCYDRSVCARPSGTRRLVKTLKA